MSLVVLKEFMVTWTELKTIKTSTSMPLYYSQYETSPNKYLVVLSTQVFQVAAKVRASGDVTDFENNFKSAATSSATEDGARCLSLANVNQTPVPTSLTDMIYESASHGQSDSSEQDMISYTVTTGKTFYLIKYSVHKDDDNVKKARFMIKVNGAVKDSGYSMGDAQNIFLKFEPKEPIPFANSGDIIKITRNSSTAGETTFYRCVTNV